SLHSDVIFDGKNYLGVSTKKLNAPKAANISTINVVTNYTQDEWKIESCDQAGTPVATPSWLTLTKIPGKISFDMTDNTLPDAVPRETFVKLSVPTNSRMSMIVSVKQSHTDVLPISFEPQIVTASWNASSGVFKSKATLLASGTKWLVKSLTLREDKGLDWCRLSGATVVGSNGTTTAAEQGFELVFDVDKMSSTLLARTAQVAIDVTDPSGVTDTHIVTLTQSGISNTISVGRLYIAKTAEYSIEKISVITTGEWTATFKTGNTTTATDGCTWLNFTDESSAPLTNPKQCKGMGSGSIYVKFDACGANTVRNGYIVVTNGTTEQWIRVHQGDYRTVKINGYEMLDRNLGATMAPTNPIVNASNAATHGYLYQWGRRPDGYEALTPTDTKVCFAAPATSAERITHQLTFGDPAWGKYIYVGVTSALNSSNGHWLYPDGSITPPDQHTVGELWDSRSIPSNTLSQTNITPMRTDYDPCPDGWRVPSAREMDNAVRQGFMQLKPIIRESERAYHGRFIAAESGGEVCFPTSNNRFHATGGSFVTDGDFTSDLLAAGWYWTSSYSASGSPYALRIIRSNLPDLIYTLNRPGQVPDIYPPKSANTQTENLTGAHLMGVRCIRDRKITEELSVSVRRKTVDMESQTTTSTLTTKNLVGSWSAATSDASWLTVSPAGGSGNGDLSIRVTKNDTPYVRQGEIRITTTSGTVA
ncbi:MAG: BACON domain-containing carbohydrate-binding protein, partial [Rikenellaceae bacterium]